MISTYTTNLGYNGTGIGARDFDGGPTMFLNLVDSLAAGGVSPLVINLNFTTAGTAYNTLMKVKTVTIQGEDVKIIAMTHMRIDTLTKLPTGVSPYNAYSTAARITDILGPASKYVIMLSKQSTLSDDVDFLQQSGLTSFVDIVVATYGSEMQQGSQGCINGIVCNGNYPFSAVSSNGVNNYIVAVAPPLGMGVGILNVTFDTTGVLTNWTGDNIIFNRTHYSPDPVVELDIYNRKQQVIAFSSKIVGSTPELLVGDGSDADRPCRWKQCSFGCLVADAMRNYSNVDIGIIEGGSVRANITAGNITYGEILLSLPFLNNVATFQIQGNTLLDVLNHGVRNMFISGSGRFLQVSGLQFQYNPNLPATGNRLITVSVLNRDTGAYEPLDTLKTYSMATTNFMFLGGDGYNAVGLPSLAINTAPYGPLLTDVVLNYINDKVSEGDLAYFQSLDLDPRVITTDLTQAFVPTTQPIVITFRSVPDGLSAAFTVITGVLALIAIVIGAYIWHHRFHAVTVIASPFFCLIILGGVLLSHLAVMIFIHVKNDAGCMAFPWIGNFAFVIIFGALFAKTWRIDMIFASSKKLKTKKRAISNGLLLLVIGILLLIESFILGLWTGLSPLKYKLITDFSRRESRYSCSSTNGVYFFAASIAYKGVLMLWGMYLVIKTRNIDSDFRESTFIGWVIYAVFFTVAVIVTICLLLKTNVVGVFVLIIIGFWIVTLSVLGAIFVPKMIEIYTHPHLVWAIYFQKRAENMKMGTGSVFTKGHSLSNDSIHEKMDGMTITGLETLLEECEMREKALKQSLSEIAKDISTVKAKIAKKDKETKSNKK